MIEYFDDPGGERGLAEAAAKHARAGSNYVVLLRPTRPADLAREVLQAFGKRLDLSGRPTSTSRAWDLVAIWNQALDTKVPMLVNGEFLDSSCIPLMTDLPGRRGDVTVIVDSLAATKGLMRALQQHATRLELDEPVATWLLQTQDVPSAESEHDEDQRPAQFPRCPTDAFPFFLPALRRSLSARDFEYVYGIYLQAFSQAKLMYLREPDPGPDRQIDSIAVLLKQMLADSVDAHESLVRIRAGEHALLHLGYLLRVDLNRFHHTAGVGTAPPIEVARERINWYTDPKWAVVAALGSMGMDAQAIAYLNADQVYGAWNEASTPPKDRIETSGVRWPIPSEYMPAFKAYRHDQASSLPAQGPLLRNTAGNRIASKTVKSMLRAIAEETGLPVAAHWSPPADQLATHWMRAHGLSLTPLT